MTHHTPADTARFWAKVSKTATCWEWTAGKSGDGYGAFRLDGKMVRSHRMAFELAKGPIPEGTFIDHMCHRRACVNPDHLRAATQKQNQENLLGTQANNTSGVRGVFFDTAKQKWQGRVIHNRKSYHAGFFVDLADAEAAVIALRNELFTHNLSDRTSA